MNVHSMFLVMLLPMAWLCPAFGQTMPAAVSSSKRMGHAVRSPEVHADGSVTFRFYSPNSKRVLLALEGRPTKDMAKEADGIWSSTTELLAPDFYGYRFIVDDLPLEDPANELSHSIVSGGHESLLHVPGSASLAWESNNVPHGLLHRHQYRSEALGEERGFWVYTPPGYNPQAKDLYPMLVLLHGVMDEDSAWLTSGRAPVILDNLIARREARPMVVVFPLGYGFPDVPERVSECFLGPARQQKLMDVFAETLLKEVIPLVESEYWIAPQPQDRAIAGLSMGGAQALYLGYKHPERFQWIGSFSGAVIMFGGAFEKYFPGLGPQLNHLLKLVWIACGTSDFLLGQSRTYTNWLQSKGMQFTQVETAGSHTWMVWRRNLVAFLGQLFKPGTTLPR